MCNRTFDDRLYQSKGLHKARPLGFTYHEMNEIWLQGTPLHERFVLYLKDPMVDHIQISCNLNRKAFMLFTLGKACSHRSPHLGYYL
jgi:hypothetical protein